MTMDIEALVLDTQVIIDIYLDEHGLPRDYDLTTPRPIVEPTIDDLLCPVCAAFTGSGGCIEHR